MNNTGIFSMFFLRIICVMELQMQLHRICLSGSFFQTEQCPLFSMIIYLSATRITGKKKDRCGDPSLSILLSEIEFLLLRLLNRGSSNNSGRCSCDFFNCFFLFQCLFRIFVSHTLSPPIFWCIYFNCYILLSLYPFNAFRTSYSGLSAPV